MNNRNIDNLNQGSDKANEMNKNEEENVVRLKVKPRSTDNEKLVEVNYPTPTLLSIVLKDVAEWSGNAFVLEPTLNTQIQIFAPMGLPKDRAFRLFLESLSVINLRAVQIDELFKIVPVQTIVVA